MIFADLSQAPTRRPRFAASTLPLVPGKPQCASDGCTADAAPALSLCANCDAEYSANVAYVQSCDDRAKNYEPLFVFGFFTFAAALVQGMGPRALSGLVFVVGVVVGLFFAWFWKASVRPVDGKVVR